MSEDFVARALARQRVEQELAQEAERAIARDYEQYVEEQRASSQESKEHSVRPRRGWRNLFLWRRHG